MRDTSVSKVKSQFSPRGEMGQIYLAAGVHLGMRLWEEQPGQAKAASTRDYETVGYVLSGRAEVSVEGQTLKREPGDSWLVPAGAEHCYRILERFSALEATSPPAHVHGRDAP